MDRVTGLTAFFHESGDAVFFESLISQLYIKHKKNVDKETIAAAILSNHRLSKSEPNSFGRLGLYQYEPSSGFTTSEEFETQCIEFLGYIAKGYEYRENPIPGNEGSFHIRKGRNFLYPDDEDVWYGNYEGFFFRRSELVKFFPELENNYLIDDTSSIGTERVEEHWRGREYGWKMIIGLTIALSESSSDFKFPTSNELNMSAIYRKIADTLAIHEGIEVKENTLHKILDSAVKKYAPNFLEKISNSKE